MPSAAAALLCLCDFVSIIVTHAAATTYADLSFSGFHPGLSRPRLSFQMWRKSRRCCRVVSLCTLAAVSETGQTGQLLSHLLGEPHCLWAENCTSISKIGSSFGYLVNKTIQLLGA